LTADVILVISLPENGRNCASVSSPAAAATG
jgi:hypothetical protein